MLRFRIRMRPRRMAGAEGLGGGQEGRLKHLKKLVTQLIKNERIETSWARCDEARGYAEKANILFFFFLLYIPKIYVVMYQIILYYLLAVRCNIIS